MILHIFYSCSEYIACKVAVAVVAAFCIYDLQVDIQEAIEGAWDIAGGNGASMLRHLRRYHGGQMCLWIVDMKIEFPGCGEIFGCAAGRIALLSCAGLDHETVVKEALHEVGHLMGLSHCDQDCFMRFSPSVEQARAKAGDLCPQCKGRLLANRYGR